MVEQHNYKLNIYTSTALKTNKHLYQERLSVSMGVVFLYSSFLVYIQQSTAVMLCTAAHVHPCRVREKGKREREGERKWEGGRRENLAFTVRDQRYIMGGQTILLHAVFLTNHYTTKQYKHILYKSKAACQTLITIALVAQTANICILNLYANRWGLGSLFNGNMFSLPDQFI